MEAERLTRNYGLPCETLLTSDVVHVILLKRLLFGAKQRLPEMKLILVF